MTEGCRHPETQALRDLLALRAVTPDPAQPGLREALMTIREKYGKVCEDYEVCVHDACASSYGAWATADAALRAATPDPAEPGLREALQGAVDAWTAEYGPDNNAPWVTKALRALSEATEGQS
jgi:hypothetical protein